MSDQPTNERFKAEMPQIPGVSGPGSSRPSPASTVLKVLGALVVVLLIVVAVGRVLSRKHSTEPAASEAAAPMDTPTTAPDLGSAVPKAVEANPGIATVGDMAKPWSSQEFTYRNGLTGEQIPSMLVRLPSGSASQGSGYWAFSLKAAYGNCKLEYISDVAKLKNDYGYRAASHPMVGNPCSSTLFDPTKMASLPGNVWVRGAIVQGSDLRPPIGIEVNVKGKDIFANRME